MKGLIICLIVAVASLVGFSNTASAYIYDTTVNLTEETLTPNCTAYTITLSTVQVSRIVASRAGKTQDVWLVITSTSGAYIGPSGTATGSTLSTSYAENLRNNGCYVPGLDALAYGNNVFHITNYTGALYATSGSVGVADAATANTVKISVFIKYKQ